MSHKTEETGKVNSGDNFFAFMCVYLCVCVFVCMCVCSYLDKITQDTL